MPDITFDGPGGSTRNQVLKGAHHEEEFTYGRNRWKATATVTGDPRGYASGDVIGEPLTFAVNQPHASKGRVLGARVLDKSGQAVALDIVVYSSQMDGSGDRAQSDPSDTVLGTVAGVVPVLATDYATFVDNSFANVNSQFVFELDTSGYLMAEVVIREAVAFAATGDIVVTLVGVL